MPDPDTVGSRSKRLRLPLMVGGAAVVCALGLLYGIGVGGKEAAPACPGGDAAVARLDPLVHGEVAAFGLSKPARRAPALTFNGPDGAPVTLASFKGKTVLVNLWATWCIPCRKEMPALDRLQARLGGPDFEVVAVNVDTARLEGPKTFLKDTGVANLSYYADPTAAVLQQLKTEGQLLGLPTTLLIDRNGCEIGTMAGPAEWSSPEAEQLVTAAKS